MYVGVQVWKGSLWGKPVAVKLLPLLDVDERQLECLRREVAVLLHTTGECKQVGRGPGRQDHAHCQALSQTELRISSAVATENPQPRGAGLGPYLSRLQVVGSSNEGCVVACAAPHSSWLNFHFLCVCMSCRCASTRGFV